MPKRQGNSYPSRKRQRHGKTSLHNQIATLQATLLTTTRTLAGCLKKTGKQETKESSDSSSESSQGDSTETQEITDDLLTYIHFIVGVSHQFHSALEVLEVGRNFALDLNFNRGFSTNCLGNPKKLFPIF